jgi:hypothetical protein
MHEAAKRAAPELIRDWVFADEAAKYLGVSTGTLAQWRSNKSRNLRWINLVPVRYKISDLKAFVNANASPDTSANENPRRKYRRRAK